jgi:hypothetical protein
MGGPTSRAPGKPTTNQLHQQLGLFQYLIPSVQLSSLCSQPVLADITLTSAGASLPPGNSHSQSSGTPRQHVFPSCIMLQLSHSTTIRLVRQWITRAAAPAGAGLNTKPHHTSFTNSRTTTGQQGPPAGSGSANYNMEKLCLPGAHARTACICKECATGHRACTGPSLSPEPS